MELIAEYINHLELNQVLSFNSLRLYKRDLIDFDSFCRQSYASGFELAKLNQQVLTKFSDYILAQGKSIASVNRKLTALHGFWVWLRDKNLVSKDPFTQLNRDTQFRNKQITFLSEDEIVILLDCQDLDLRTKLLLELVYATGIRVGEITKLTLADIDLENQLITIPRSNRFKERTIPFNKLLLNYFQQYIETKQLTENSKLFLNKWNEPVSEREIFRLLREAARQAGLNKKVTPSILRNTFIKHMKNNGAHETLLRDITGQKRVIP